MMREKLVKRIKTLVVKKKVINPLKPFVISLSLSHLVFISKWACYLIKSSTNNDKKKNFFYVISERYYLQVYRRSRAKKRTISVELKKQSLCIRRRKHRIATKVFFSHPLFFKVLCASGEVAHSPLNKRLIPSD